MAYRRLTKAERDGADSKSDDAIMSMMTDRKGWPAVVASAKAGDLGAHDILARAMKLCIDGAPYISPTTGKVESMTTKRSAPVSAAKTNVVKREEITVKEIEVNTVNELLALVSKGIPKGMKVSIPTDSGRRSLTEEQLDAVEQFLVGTAGTGSEEVFSTMPGASPARFPASSSIVDRPVREEDDNVSPLKPYDVTYPGIVRVGPFAVLSPNADPLGRRPEPFNAPEPKDRHDADHADPNAAEVRTDGWLGGLKPVSKSSPTLKSGAVKKGTFAGTATDWSKPQDHEGR